MTLRSERWFGGADLAGFIHRASIHALPGEAPETEPYGLLSGWVGGW
jgi:hypothetical protein